MYPDAFDAQTGSAVDIRLEVPGEDTYLEFLRGVVGRAARIRGFTYAGIEDFALAVDEAAVLLLERKPPLLVLEVHAVGEAGRLTAIVSSPIEDGDWPPPGLDDDTRWQILSALCEEVWVTEGRAPGIGLVQSVR